MVFNYIIYKVSFGFKIVSFPNYAFLYLKRKMNETRIYVTAIYVKQIFSISGFSFWVGPPAVGECRISSLISVHLVQVLVELTRPLKSRDLGLANQQHPSIPQPTVFASWTCELN